MEIKMLRKGLFTSIQDFGRKGYASSGVPESGVMDRYAAGVANLLLGNEENDPLLEMTQLGPKLQFTDELEVVLTGLKVEAFLGDEKVPIARPIRVKKGDILDIKRISEGNFAYLAIQGGFISKKVLSSRSMSRGITQKFRLDKGDKLYCITSNDTPEKKGAKIHFNLRHYKRDCVNVLPGPDYSKLSPESRKRLTNQPFTLSKEINRMAFPLAETLAPHHFSMLTTPVLPGTVQWTPDGKVIILMREAQVTGGYPRLLQVLEEDLDILSQRSLEAPFFFKLKKAGLPITP